MSHHSENDPTQICRICMHDISDQASKNLYELLHPEQLSLSSMLSTICPAVFSSGVDLQNRHAMPEQICPSCVLQIEAAYELHQTCIESDRKLCETFLVKQEEIQIEEVKIQMPPEYDQEPISMKAEQLETNDEEKNIEEADKTVAKEGNVSKVRRQHPGIKSKKDTQQVCSELNLNEIKSTIGTKKDASNSAGMACVFCKTTKFRRINLLKIHLRTDHASQVFPCDSCHNVYLREEELADHKLYHETGRRHGCSTCGKRYKLASHLKHHRNLHNEESAFLCPTCGKSFQNKATMYNHMLRHSEKKFACDQCPAKFFLKGGLKAHQLTHTKEKGFVCDICSARFSMKNTLVKHMTKHSDNPPIYSCDVCHRNFSSASHVKRHKRTHTGEKPYKCTECDRSFSQSNDLVKHSKSHFGDKPYQCDRCDESFRLISDLRDHYKTHANLADDGEDSDGNKKTTKTSWFTSSKVLKRRFQRKPVNNSDNSSDEEPETGLSGMVDVSQLPIMTGGNS